MNVGNVFGNVLRGFGNKDDGKELSAKRAQQLRQEGQFEQGDHSHNPDGKEQVWELMGSCMRAIYDCDSFTSALQQIVSQAGDYMGSNRAYCFWMKDDAVSYSFTWDASEGTCTQTQEIERGERRVELWHSFFDEREYVLLAEPEDMKDAIPSSLTEGFLKEQLSGLILIPLSYQDQLIQMVAFDNPKLAREELSALTDSLYCLFNISLCRVYDKKRNFELTYYDSLTGLYNRAKFWKDMRSATEQERSCTGIVLLHMQDLQKINESQGHEAGNQMLKRFAAVIDEIMPGEIVYRIGGSEFVLWMQQLEQLEFADKVLALREAFPEDEAQLAASWTEYAPDLYQMAMATDEELYQKLSEKERKYHFRR